MVYLLPKKKDSTGICFIGERRFRQFLKTYLPCNTGDIVDLNGNVVGKHEGVIYYTLGQRRGLGIGGKHGGNGERWFVIQKDLKNNVLYVSQGEDDELFTSGLTSGKFNWIPCKPSQNEFDCYAKFRYRQPDQKVHVKIVDDYAEILFYQKQRAITPGQYVVLYDEDGNCLGGAEIEKTKK